MENSFPVLDLMPVGFRFNPTDEELIDHYLKNKLLCKDSNVHNIIAEVDVCKFEPWDLPAMSVVKSDDPEWFFFSPRDYKFAKSKKVNRTTKCGFWKPTGNHRNIRIRGTNNVIGTKKTLVYYEGRVPDGIKRNWVIHEYHAITFDETKRNYVLCRLMKKAEKNSEGQKEGGPSRYMVAEHKNQSTVEEIPDLGGSLPDMNTMESIFEAPHQADQCFPYSIQQSPPNENNIMQTPFKTIEEQENELVDSFTSFRDENNILETTIDEDELVNSFLADMDVVFSEKNKAHAFVNGCSQIETSKRVYEHPTKIPKTSYGDDPNGSTSFQSSNNDANKDKKESLLTSSCDSTADKPLKINCIEISSSHSNLRRWKNQYHPRQANSA